MYFIIEEREGGEFSKKIRPAGPINGRPVWTLECHSQLSERQAVFSRK
jgi:hypothetical protein